MRLAFVATSLAVVAAAACTSDPRYLPAPTAIEVGVDTGDPTMPPATTATASMTLPIVPETMADQDAREARQTALGAELAYVRVGDLDVSIEWTVKNLAATAGQFRVKLDGGNQFFYYLPANFIVDPRDPPPPSLAGGIPMTIAANGTVSGVLREDTLREASLDLEAITRGELSPFAAIFNVNEDDATVPIAPMAALAIPQDAVSQMIRFDVTLEADQHMILEYAVRVRDQRGILHDELMAAPAAEVVAFAPAEYVPPPPPAP